MSAEITITPPAQEEPNPRTHKKPEPERDQRTAPRKSIPTREECQRQIASLPGLVAVKAISPSQANTIRASLQVILDEHARDQHGHSSPLSDDTVRRVWKAEPQLIPLIQHLLTPEQLEMVMREANDR